MKLENTTITNGMCHLVSWEDEMNKQDLKEGQEVYVKGRVIHTGDHLDIFLDKGSFIENAIILHHEKPVVPQFVADWIEESKLRGWDLLASMCFVVSSKNKKLIKWFYSGENKNIYARAWLDGYEVEKEKRYTVKVKAVLGQYLGRYYLNNEELTPQFIRTQQTADDKIPTFTQSELEQTGFGWVFSCEGIEIEEVK